MRSESNYGILVSTSLVWYVYELIACLRKEFEHIRQDPKDGDLYLSWSKPGETLVEDLRGC
jgi:glycosylphosphatidylinositol transamidase (GPIT) subunit GPI8